MERSKKKNRGGIGTYTLTHTLTYTLTHSQTSTHTHTHTKYRSINKSAK